MDSQLPAHLGRREREIMDSVSELVRATANEMLGGLPDPPSYQQYFHALGRESGS